MAHKLAALPVHRQFSLSLWLLWPGEISRSKLNSRLIHRTRRVKAGVPLLDDDY